MRWVKNPSSGKPDPMLTLSVLVVVVASFKFLVEGVSFTVQGHEVTFGHVEALVYGTFLGPVLGVHGYVKGKKEDAKKGVDNPDAQ